MFYSLPSTSKNFFYQYLEKHGQLTSDVNKAKYILLPFDYEIIYNYSAAELSLRNITAQQLVEMRQVVDCLDKLSVVAKKKLIVFFYRDPETTLPFRNAIVFRTSGRRSKKEPFVFGMPAFIEHKHGNKNFTYRVKPAKPFVSFRGQSAPLHLPPTVAAKFIANEVMQELHFKHRFKIWYNEGYIVRRAAINSVLKKKHRMNSDFVINPIYDESDSGKYLKDYLNSFLQHDYFICAAGHGNYSYRLYEIMREGRIPVFIDTDCLLPAADLADWNNLLIWVNKSDVDKTADIIQTFHNEIHPDDFLERQYKIHTFWKNTLTQDGFSHYLTKFLGIKND